MVWYNRVMSIPQFPTYGPGHPLRSSRRPSKPPTRTDWIIFTIVVVLSFVSLLIFILQSAVFSSQRVFSHPQQEVLTQPPHHVTIVTSHLILSIHSPSRLTVSEFLRHDTQDYSYSHINEWLIISGIWYNSQRLLGRWSNVTMGRHAGLFVFRIPHKLGLTGRSRYGIIKTAYTDGNSCNIRAMCHDAKLLSQCKKLYNPYVQNDTSVHSHISLNPFYERTYH